MVEQNTPVISKVTLPSNTTYWFKDTDARNAIGQLEAIIGTATGARALVFKGVSSTELTDDGHEGPTINNTQIDLDNLSVGDIYFYNGSEFIWGPNPDYDTDDPTSHQYVWHELGNLSGLGGLAYKNNVTGSTAYQPAGTVTVNVTTSAHTYLVSSTAGTANYTPAGSVGSATFTGTTATINMSTSYTPTGSVGSATFTGTTATIAMSTSYQPAGTISKPSVQLATNGAGTTTYIDNPTARQVTSALATAAPSATAPANEITYYSVSSETLSLYKIGYSTTMSIETTSVTVKTGDGAYQLSAAPTFTGTTATIETSTSYQPAGTNSTASFTGTAATISASTTYQPAGTNSTASFTGTGVRLATGPVTLPETITATFTGTTATIEITAS